MCLSEITDRNPKPEGEGYVVLSKHNKKLYGAFYGGRKQTSRWLNEKDFRAGAKEKARSPFLNGMTSGKGKYIGVGNIKYSKGFHIHQNKESALSFLSTDQEAGFCTVRKVKYNKAVIVGRQAGYGPIVVAEEMYIYPGAVK